MSKHTPGPWRFGNDPGAGRQIYATMPEDFKFGEGSLPKGKEVAVFGLPDRFSVWSDGTALMAYEKWTRFEPETWNEMQDANGMLIAAAPELLAALKLLMREVELSGNATETGYGWPQAVAATRAAIAKAEATV